MTFIESYERQLVEAAQRQRDNRLRNRISRRFGVRMPQRRGPAIVLAALLVAVPATAATVKWNPFDDPGRDPRFPAPSLSSRPVDPQLAATLGVLRRPQNAADRGVASAKAARSFGVTDARGYRGVKVDGIRVIDADRGLVLVPFERGPVPTDSQGRALPGFDPRFYSNAVCVFEPSADGYAGLGCHTAEKIRRGFALSSGSGQAVGLVPDGVARVRLVRGGESGEATVRDNTFVAAEPTPVNPQVVEWLDADGSVVNRIDLTADRRGPAAPPSP